MSNAEAAAALNMQGGTVRAHVSPIPGKLGGDRVQEAVLAHEVGWV
ncbi:hypothetical protein [Nocardiopsis kunsanensis]|nr:hypothetical protein [Nocardiopsis kunsanensis]